MTLLPLWMLAASALCQAPEPPSQGTPDSGETTVEKVIAEAKSRAEKSRSTTTARLTQLILELDTNYDKASERIEKAIVEILTYQDAATRPLVEALREPKESQRAQNAARALARSTAANVVPELESALASTTPVEQRARIAWVLGRREGDRPAAMLRNLLLDKDPSVVAQAALGLGNLKVKDMAQGIADRLSGAPPSLARPLLVALANLEETKVVPQIAAFIETPAAGECAGSIAEVVKRLKSRELLAPSLRVVLRGGAATEDAAELVRAVESVVHSGDREVISVLKKIMAEAAISYEVKEECAYALHAAKDPSGKTWLLQSVNDAIRDNPDGVTLIRGRARIYMRLKLYKEAQRDFEEIKKLSAGGKKVTLDGEYWVEAARASSGAKGYQVAADSLRNALALGVRAKNFRDYAEFAEMRKVSKYASLFEGD